MFFCAHCGKYFVSTINLFAHLDIPPEIEFRPVGILYLPIKRPRFATPLPQNQEFVH